MHTKTFYFIRNITVLITFTIMIIGCNEGEIGGESDIAVPVSVTEAGYDSISEVFQTNGTVIATRSEDLITRVEGDYLLQNNPRTNRQFSLGDQVYEGETLIKIRNREYELANRLEAIELEYETAKQEYEKQQALYEKGGVTLRELINAERNYINAETALEETELNLNRLSLTARFTGYITKLPYYPQGAHIQNNTEVAKIMDYRELIMEVSIPSSKIPLSIEVGQSVSVNHYSLDLEKDLRGSVMEISPAMDQNTRMFDAKIRIQNPQKLLRPGMFVKANVIVQHKDSVITLPHEVVLESGDRQYVYVIEQERAFRRYVETGIESGGKVEITEGIEPGERVVIEGYETVRNRRRVNVL